jgi:hypothetical protein
MTLPTRGQVGQNTPSLANGDPTQIAEPIYWRERAEELADWTWNHLVNRTDVWGAYNPLHVRDQQYTDKGGRERRYGKLYTAPRFSRERGAVLLTRDVLLQHFKATAAEHVIGLHAISEKNTSQWGAVDIDWHGETSPAADINWRYARHLYVKCKALGLNPLLTESNGRGGYHLRVILVEPQPTSEIFDFLQSLVTDHAEHGLRTAPEIFPKQRSVQDETNQDRSKYGNWLRLPGRHHTTDHMARVWDGERWLNANLAIDFILALTGDPGSLIASTKPDSAGLFPMLFVPPTASAEISLDARIRAYMAKLPVDLGEGQHRDDYLYNFAAVLVRDLALPDDVALSYLQEWDSHQRAQKGTERIREIIVNAHTYGQRAYGCGLNGHAKNERPTTSDGELLTDAGNAARFVRRHGADFRFVHEWRKWCCWDGRRWLIDNQGIVVARAKSLVIAVYREGADAVKQLEADLEQINR